MQSQTALAYRNGQHVVLRAFSKSELRETPQAVNPESFNRFILSKNFFMLMESIDELGIMFDHDFIKGSSRIVSVETMRKAIGKGSFAPVREERLTEEIYLDSATPYKPNASALKKMAASYDFLLVGFETALKDFNGDDVVVIELIQDWIELRNSLSVTARVLGYLLNPPEKIAGIKLSEDFNGLEQAGFKKRKLERGILSGITQQYDFFKEYKSQYLIKIIFNTFFAKDPGVKGFAQVVFDTYKDKAPLHYSVLSDEKGWTSALKGNRRVNFLTAPLAKFYEHAADDKSQYLSIGEAGEDWHFLAKEFVRAMVNAYMEPKVDQNSWFNGEGYPDVMHSTLISALWYQLIYPKNYELIICQNCGNAALAAKRGMGKIWCSDACRTYYKTHFKDEE